MDDNPAEAVEVVMDDDHSEVDKSVIYGHYNLRGKAQFCINALSASLLGLSNKAMLLNKGIKVSPGDKFYYKPEKLPNLYVFEAAVAPSHAAAIMTKIHIYVKWEGKEILIATLSLAHPKVQLDLMMSQGMELSHTSRTKNVYFNACEFKPMPVYKDSIFQTDKEIWVTKVKPQEEVILNSVDDKSYHLLKVFPAEDTGEEIDLHVQCGDKQEKIGVLPKYRTFYCNLVFEGPFSVSHTSKVADMIFYGYTVSNMVTVELPGAPNLIELRPPKKCDYPEYKIFVEKRGSAKHQMRKLTTVSLSLVPAPIISCGRPNKTD